MTTGDRVGSMRSSAGRVIGVVLVTAGFVGVGSAQQQTTTPPPQTTFKSTIDMVRVSATVRDRKGHLRADLAARDFEILDAGLPRVITDFRSDLDGLSVALLFDVSGSMEAKLPDAREAAEHVLTWLDPARDESAVFTFDTTLESAAPFQRGLRHLPPSMSSVVPFGATSLNDAIARTAERVGAREGRRRAVIVLTDGNDNASRLSPSEVSGIASAIDVPVYVFGIVPAVDNPSAPISVTSEERSALTGAVANLAEWTGGRVVIASTPAQRSVAARQIVDELRHQYVIAFESNGTPGWHPLVVRARDPELVVRARSGYFAGHTQPHSASE